MARSFVGEVLDAGVNMLISFLKTTTPKVQAEPERVASQRGS